MHEDRLVPEKHQILLVGSSQREHIANTFQAVVLNTHKFSNAGIVFKIKTKLNLQLAHFLKYKRLKSSESKHIPTVEILPNSLLLEIKANVIRT